MQYASQGCMLIDDCLIEVPDTGFKLDNTFFLNQFKDGNLIGNYWYEGQLYTHTRTAGHVRVAKQSAVVISEPPAVVTSKPPAVVTSKPPAVVTSKPPAVVANEPPAVVTSEPPAVVTSEPPTVPDRFLESENIDIENISRKCLPRKAKKISRDLPLSKEEFDKVLTTTYPLKKLGLTTAGEKLIHMVRCLKNPESEDLTYQGRIQGDVTPETIYTDWMGRNGMHRDWRKRTILRYPGCWFRVPVNATVARAKHTFVTCTKTSVEKAFSYMGLKRQLERLKISNFVKKPFNQVKQEIVRMGGFQNRKRKCVTFNPLRDAKRTNLYFMQIRAKHVN